MIGGVIWNYYLGGCDLLCGNGYLANLHHWVVGGIKQANVFKIELDIGYLACSYLGEYIMPKIAQGNQNT